MLYLFLDESGDLGFDFARKKPSKHFVITILTIQGNENRKKLSLGVKKTIRKLNHKRKKSLIHELKGTSTTLAFKNYCFRQIKTSNFSIHALIVNKQRFPNYLTQKKDELYNYFTRLLLEKIPLEKVDFRIEFIVDRSKSKPEVTKFNNYIVPYLKSRIKPNISLKMYHEASQAIPNLQLVDMFAWGIFRKHESKDVTWYKIFKDKIHTEKFI